MWTFADESPLFLLRQGDFNRAERSLKLIFHRNLGKSGKTAQTTPLLNPVDEALYEANFRQFTIEKPQALKPDTVCKLGLVTSLWSCVLFNYYLFPFMLRYVSGDLFTNFYMMALAELVGPLCGSLV